MYGEVVQYLYLLLTSLFRGKTIITSVLDVLIVIENHC